MKNNKNNAELQSRREFFKNAAKSALPILGIAVLASNPIVSKGAQVMNCNSSCSGSCKNACMGCTGGCSGSCSSSCFGTCKGTTTKA